MKNSKEKKITTLQEESSRLRETDSGLDRRGTLLKENLTELVFILDRSGSMNGLESDTIGGFNSMIEKQKKEDGEAYVSTLLFDDTCEVIHDRINIRDVPRLTENEYFTRGCTALLDAVGGAVHHIGNIHKYARKDDVPAKTLFIITTDGMENSSREYTYEKVKKMIERQKEKYGWEFLFLGANIDAAETAVSIGISRDRATEYCCDAEGTALNYVVFSETVSAVRSGKGISKSWKKKIEEDHKRRGC